MPLSDFVRESKAILCAAAGSQLACRAVSLCGVVVVAHAPAHVDLVRARRWLRLRDYRGGEDSRVVVAVENVICLPAVAAAVDFRFEGVGLCCTK